MNPQGSLRANYVVLVVTLVSALVVGIDRLSFIPLLRTTSNVLLEWVVLLSAVALLVGVFNVMVVHLRQITLGQRGWQHSLALVVALLVVWTGGMLTSDGIASPLVEWLFDGIIAPGQATLFALLAFFMAGAAYQYLRVGRIGGIWMLAGALLIFLVQLPFSNALLPDSVKALAEWLLNVPGMAAIRGLLLGSSFALTIVGIRYLLSVK